MKYSILLMMVTMVKSWGDQGLGKKELADPTANEDCVISIT